MTLEKLLAREQIRQLRIDYSNLYDAWQFDGLAELFCEDAVCEFPAAFGDRIAGRAAIMEVYKRWAGEGKAPFDAVHIVANHHIDLLGPEHARGHCMLLDWLTRQHAGSPLVTMGGHSNPLLLIGRYQDDYRLEDGRWRFARVRLSTYWPQREVAAQD